jgi:hypothetical protein
MKKSLPALLATGRSKAWTVCFASVIAFTAGSLFTARLTRLQPVRADSNRVFELRVYHTIPGKVQALESIFRDLSPLMTKHEINVIGYWVPDDSDPAWASTLVYLVAHPSQADAKKNWAALHADPAFPEYRKQAIPLIEKTNDQFKVDEVYMRPTDFSAMK